MNLFPDLFHAAAYIAAIAASMAVCIQRGYAALRRRRHPRAAAGAVYLLGMYRSFGVDFENYVGYLGPSGNASLIWDIACLMEITHFLGISLSEFFLAQALFTLVAIQILANKLKSDFVVTISLYILHAAIVRDFSQSSNT